MIPFDDDLRSERGPVRGVLALAEPETTREPVWDAAVAAVVTRRLREDAVPLPDWVNASSRTLAQPRTLQVDPADPVPAPAQVPAEFARRGVLVWGDTFASV